MLNYYYKDSIQAFLQKSSAEIIGTITLANKFDSTMLQNKAWEKQISVLKDVLIDKKGEILFEFSIPRMGKRIDCLLIIQNIVFVLEFKIGEREYFNNSLEQVWDYALDLKNFHEPSHNLLLVPILVATEATHSFCDFITIDDDNLVKPLKSNAKGLKEVIHKVITDMSKDTHVDSEKYLQGKYLPTPTIIEAAVTLYNNHNVEEITRSDAKAKNIKVTTTYISDIIEYAKTNNKKVICFVTGVPGAGKTLVGLKVAADH